MERIVLLPFTISTVTRILLHAISIFIILKSTIKCSKNKRAIAGVKSSRTVKPLSPLQNPPRRHGDSPKPKSTSGNVLTNTTSDKGVGASGAMQTSTADAHVPPVPPLPEDGTQIQLDEKENVKDPSFLPYPNVKTPSPSVVKRRRDELEKDKKQKIAEGFYQERSDEDDTLEKVKSLKMEQSEASRKASARIAAASQKRKPDVSKLLTARGQ